MDIHAKYPVILFRFQWNLNLEKFSKNTQIWKFHENPSIGSWVVSCELTDRWTDRHDEANSLFSDFAKAPKNERFYGKSCTSCKNLINNFKGAYIFQYKQQVNASLDHLIHMVFLYEIISLFLFKPTLLHFCCTWCSQSILNAPNHSTPRTGPFYSHIIMAENVVHN